jgi:hypothetical protein
MAIVYVSAWHAEVHSGRQMALSWYTIVLHLTCGVPKTYAVGLDYSIAPGQACGLRSSLGDLLSVLPARALPARLCDDAAPA